MPTHQAADGERGDVAQGDCQAQHEQQASPACDVLTRRHDEGQKPCQVRPAQCRECQMSHAVLDLVEQQRLERRDQKQRRRESEEQIQREQGRRRGNGSEGQENKPVRAAQFHEGGVFAQALEGEGERKDRCRPGT